MTKFGETSKFKAPDHLSTLEKYLGEGVVDCVLLAKTRKYPRGVLNRYKQEKAYPVVDGLNGGKDTTIIRRSLMASRIFSKPKSDKVKRSLIRHDSKKLAKALVSLL